MLDIDKVFAIGQAEYHRINRIYNRLEDMFYCGEYDDAGRVTRHFDAGMRRLIALELRYFHANYEGVIAL